MMEFLIKRFEEIDSTNSALLDLAQKGAEEFTCVIARYQTLGRGRVGRSFVAPPGANLLFSYLAYPETSNYFQYAMVMSLAAASAIEQFGSVRALIKWPNDLIVNSTKTLVGEYKGKEELKIGGTLVEIKELDSPKVNAKRVALVGGIGINVMWPNVAEIEQDVLLNPYLNEMNRWTALDRIAGKDISLSEFENCFLANLGKYLSFVSIMDSEVNFADYKSRLSTLNRFVAIQLEGGSRVLGYATDISDMGELILETDSGKIKISVGDVHHLRTFSDI